MVHKRNVDKSYKLENSLWDFLVHYKNFLFDIDFSNSYDDLSSNKKVKIESIQVVKLLSV